MKRNYKSLLSIALVLLLVAITSLTFAYWDQLTKTVDDDIITIGTGKVLSVNNVTPSTDNLIPDGAVKGANDVYFIDVTYTVNLTEFVAGYELNVTVTTENALLVGAVQTFTQFTSTDTTEEITIRFTLNEPTDEAEYLALQAMKPLTYTVVFAYQVA